MKKRARAMKMDYRSIIRSFRKVRKCDECGTSCPDPSQVRRGSGAWDDGKIIRVERLGFLPSSVGRADTFPELGKA